MNTKFIVLAFILSIFNYTSFAQSIELYNASYQGAVVHDTIPNGKGILTYYSGEIINGVFAEGNIHGMAEITYNGNIASGFFNIGELDEAEIFISNTHSKDIDSIYYKGTVKLHRTAEGASYDFILGNHVIEKTGHGQLKIFYSSGDSLIYHGQFLHDLMHGQGVLFDGRLGYKYQGHFTNNLKDGSGEMKFQEGAYYRGYLDDEEFNGRGFFRYGTDSTEFAYYNGAWRHGKWHGRGLLKYKDGGTYTGEFFEGKMQGEGKRVFKDGSYIRGHFLNGKPTKIIESKYVGG